MRLENIDMGKNVSLVCQEEKCAVFKMKDDTGEGINIEHIFSELYNLPDRIRIPYLKIKILELLLFLNEQEIPAGSGERTYFYKTQVDKVKAMKLCFKGGYGNMTTPASFPRSLSP